MITTERDKFVGSHMTQVVKDQLKEEAKKKEISVSQLIFNISKDYLRVAGYNPDQPTERQKEKLPFETSDPPLQQERSEPVGHPERTD